MIGGGGDDPQGRGETSTATPTAVPTVEVVDRVGKRPNSIAVSEGTVFVTNYRNKRLTLLDEQTGKERRKGPNVGIGSRDVATGLGAAWVAVSRQKALFKLDPSTGRRLGRVALPTSPQGVAAGKDAVWVGLSTLEEDTPDTLARIDPRSLEVTDTYPMIEGIRTLVASPTDIWVVHRNNPAVSRFDPVARQVTRRVAVGETEAGAAAYGAGAVWVTSPQEDTVARIDGKTGSKVSSGVGRRPTGIAARGRQIWVTSLIDHTVQRLDPKTGRPVGEPVEAPLNPYALTLTSDTLWLTAVGRGQIARLREPARDRAG